VQGGESSVIEAQHDAEFGVASNLAARLESVTGKTDRDILVSEAFVTQFGAGRFESVGAFDMKGFAEPVNAHTPR
jgi:class 3 adenylate cyclase